MISSCDDPLNRRILCVAEDCVAGFHRFPFAEIARRCELPEALVIDRLLAMWQAGTVRRVRQTLLSTSLAEGALVAWKLPEERLEAAWEWLRAHDPFTGHAVLRRCDNPQSPGADYQLWTTLKVPTGYGSSDEHCAILARYIGAEDCVQLPVVGMFTLAVGHTRRAGLRPGDKLAEPPVMQVPQHPVLTPEEWEVLLSLKESLTAEEFVPCPWEGRAKVLGMSVDRYCDIASSLDARRVIGRFATFLDHTSARNKKAGIGAAGLFHWAVPVGMEERAGAECGRHICMTHCYWRSGGAVFGGAQIMGVVHASTYEEVLAHKAAIDQHLADCGIPVLHTAIFRSHRAEIRPSEISPTRYQDWLSHWA